MDKSVTGGERDIEKEDHFVHASRAAKMTDAKSVSSMEMPEGKLMKKVSGYLSQPIRLQHPNPVTGPFTSPT